MSPIIEKDITMKHITLEISVFLVLVALIVISGLAGYGVSSQNETTNAPELTSTPVYATIAPQSPRTAFYEDLSGIVDYGTYEVHYSEDGIEVWYIFGVYNTPCDGASLDGKYCVLVGNDSIQEFAKEAQLW